MAIVNGTFNTDLSGWTPSGDGSYDVIWENSGPTPGRARLRISHCSHAAIQQTFLINANDLKFDWQTHSDGWYENPVWNLIVDGAIVIYEGFPIGPSTGYSGTRSVDVSGYIGKTATIRFYLEPGSHCANGDHYATYLWVDNIMLTGTAPNVGSIAFSSVPSGASITLDNTDTGHTTPYTVSNLVPGTYSYILRLANYQVYPGTVDVLSGQEANVTVTLQHLYGDLYVTSVPTGAKIFIDEEDTGQTTPITIKNLTAGSHIYRLSKFAYYDSIGTIDIVANSSVTLSVTMVAMATTCQAFSSIPKGAEIIVNGWDLGYKTPINLCEIPYGYNYFELEGTFTIEVKGKPIQPFVSVPTGAKVIVDGSYMGDTPIVLKDIPVGTHAYRLMGTFTA